MISEAAYNHFFTNGLFGQVETTFAVNAAIFVIGFTVLNFTVAFNLFKRRIALFAVAIFAFFTSENNTFEANVIHQIVAILAFLAVLLSFGVFVLDAIFYTFQTLALLYVVSFHK